MPKKLIGKDLDIAYQEMAWDEAREAEALEWAEALGSSGWQIVAMRTQPHFTPLPPLPMQNRCRSPRT